MEIQTKGASKKQAQIVLDCDLISEFRIIKELIQQRAELLDALKMLFEDADSTCETYYIAKAAINRAEAAE